MADVASAAASAAATPAPDNNGTSKITMLFEASEQLKNTAPPAASTHHPTAPSPLATTTMAPIVLAHDPLLHRRNTVLATTAFVGVLVLAVVLGIVYGRGTHVAPPVKPAVLYALAEDVPVFGCIPVSSEEILNGTALRGAVELRSVRSSLRHYMDEKQLHGICAQYLQRHRICMCLVNMVRTPDEPSQVLEMFNMRIIGDSPTRLVRNTERSILCQKPYQTRRYRDITVAFVNEEGVLREREVFGMAAQTIQQLDDVQSGRGYCQDSNLEALAVEIRQRSGRIEQMLHDAIAGAAPPPAHAQLPRGGDSVRLPAAN